MKKLLFIAAAISLMAVPALANTVLWDQYAPDPSVGAANDFEAGCGFGAVTAFHANDVTFTENVTINTVKTVYDYYNDSGSDLIDWATEGYLMFVPKTGNLTWPENDPRADGTVPVTVTIVNIDGTDYQELSATDLGIELAAGDYWVSFTPIAMTPIGLSNQHYIATTQVGDGLMYLNLCTNGPWFTAVDLFGINVDSTLLIEGTTSSVANEDASLGSVKALYR